MRVLAKNAVAFMVLLILTGCATAPEIPFDRSTAELKSIGLVDPDMPERANVVLAATVGQSFGLIGSLVDAAAQDARISKFDKIAKSQNFSAHEAFVQDLTTALQNRGYTVAHATASRAKAHEFVASFPAGDVQEDAYLDVIVVNYGYLSAGVGGAPYRPTVAVKCRLTSARTGKVLMQDQIIYNALGSAKNTVLISPDPEYSYKTFVDLENSPEQAVAGLSHALSKTADTLANLLR